MRETHNRRGFLMGAAGLVASPPPLAAQREIRVAHIGVGLRGAGLLQQVLAQANTRVAAVCDIEPDKRDAAQTLARRDNPRAFADYRHVLDLKDVDAVVVATPCDLHAEMAAACLAAGKYVYCEKPLGITPEQVDLVLRAARRAAAFLQIGQQLRYYPNMRESLRRIHEENILGRPFVIKAQRHGTPPAPGKERQRPAWYDDVRRSGDLIVENAVHNLDVCNWIAAGRPVSAYGHGKKYLPKPVPPGTVMMDAFSVEYIYDNDMHLDYSQLYLHPRGLKSLANAQWYLVFGEKGALDISEGRFYPMQEAGPPIELFSPAVKEAKENAMEDFLACIRENRRPFAGIEVAATAALTAILGREAIYRRRMVTWAELGITI